jgi:hypothetical protein
MRWKVLPLVAWITSSVPWLVSSSLKPPEGDSRDCLPPGAVDRPVLMQVFVMAGGGGPACSGGHVAGSAGMAPWCVQQQLYRASLMVCIQIEHSCSTDTAWFPAGSTSASDQLSV